MRQIEARLPFHGPRAVGGMRRQAPAWETGAREARRLFVGSAGPVAVAGTQFAASMLLWAHVSAQAFGIFAFVLLLIQLSFGLSNALVGTPLSVTRHGADADRDRDACLAAHGLLLAAVAVVIPVAAVLAAARGSALAFALLAVSANLRWAARSHAIAEEQVARSAASDGLYALGVAAALTLAAALQQVSLTSIAAALAAANIGALAVSSRDFLARQRAALTRAALRRYQRHIWPQQAGWSMVGVIATEASSNAHAYIVTYLCGAKLFAPLAFGSLFVRPLTIFLTALNQIDRPVFARHLHGGAHHRVRTLFGLNYAAVALAWLGNVALALIALWLFAGVIAANGYAVAEVRIVVLLWLAIMACRALRNPVATFLQADRRFRPLAQCSLASAAVSIVAVWWFARTSPALSLAGILIGELLLLALVAAAYRRTRP